jgi:hypothetical protein
MLANFRQQLARAVGLRHIVITPRAAFAIFSSPLSAYEVTAMIGRAAA